ncbi:serine/threonine-protein kinase [Colwellia sp. Arc7-635]|uniref:serine/threonine-protein kinase n=1 Tax=Colwellia sp. Arc7-635 TaxID=2497879 RepID=UPI000F851E6B|nr:serine/threonine-protein kinase [Colwellia sp. Arc7-635]AZQ83206.1 serine/threonine-protein kinase [Colwellia sp. Arc7-635]
MKKTKPVNQPNHISNTNHSDDVSQNCDTIAISVADTLCDQPTLLSDDQQAEKLKQSSMAHFKIIDILGKGGMGAVYKAKDLALERFVAIKMLRISDANQPLILAEAKTISQLNHPNIVTVYDIARDGDANFIVMEWVNGLPLDRMIPPQGLALKVVVDYAKQMVAALACAHQQHIIHRDIKPQNIMVDINGRIKILDFGIAALIDPNKAKITPSAVQASFADDNLVAEEIKHHTLPSRIEGSPQYMSPEQVLGQASDARSDLFSLGIVLYEMLTGVKPFLGLNLPQIRQAISLGEYTPLADVAAERKAEAKTENKIESKAEGSTEQKLKLPAELIAVVDKLLQTEPSARYQNATDLAQDIDIIDRVINHKKNWWQQQHWLIKSLLIIPVIATLAWSTRSILFPPSTQELIARQLVEAKKIAFLPFENISGDPVLQIFSDGIATMLSSDLAEVGYQQGDGSTWVLPASEIRRLDDPSVAGIYNKYGVDTVITGSIQHMGSTRSLHLSVVNGSDGRQLKSLQLTLDAENLFAAQSEIRQQVIKLLGWQIPAALSQQFAAQQPAFDGAYKHYLQGQGYLYRFDHGDNINKALASFQAAIELDSNYADAYVGLAEAQLRSFIEIKDVNLLVPMENTVAQLTEIDSRHRLLSYLEGELKLNQGDYDHAVKLFSKSIDLQPNFLTAYTGISDAYIQLGELVKAEQFLLKANKLMPNNNSVLANLGAFHFNNGNYNQALEYFELLSQQAPNSYIAYLNISACYYLNGDINQAILAAEQSISLQPNADGFANIGTAYFYLKNYDRSIAAFEQMIALNDSDYINWGNLADAYRFAKNDKYKATFQKAINLAEDALTLNPNNKNAIASLAYYYANLEDIEKNNFYANKIIASDTGADNFLIAAAYARLKMNQAALSYLKFAINNNYSITEIKNSPLFNNLKNEDEFQQLIAKDSK